MAKELKSKPQWPGVVIGGMITSTLITLLFIPTIYIIIEKRSSHEKVEADESIAEGMPEPLQPLGAD